jgi:integrase
VSPFAPKDRKSYKMRIRLLNGRSAIRACGTADASTAADVARMVEGFRHRRDWAPLEAVVAKQITLGELYDAHGRGDVQALLTRAREAERDIDIAPLVTKWNGRGKRTINAKYLAQVRRFIPAGARFPLTQFNRGTISAHLEALPVSDPTRNRHKAAISQFARWLVQHGHLETNPVREATSFSENDPRMIHLTPAQARTVVDALSGEARIVAALMAGTGMEWQAVAAARRRDVDLERRTIHAHGAKNRHRDRVVRVTEDWCWKIIRPHVRLMTPDTPLVSIQERAALTEQLAVCARLKYPRHVLHSWRSTYAITALKRGDEPARVKRQLGHAPNSVLLYSVYGAYIPDLSTEEPAATHPATRPKVISR